MNSECVTKKKKRKKKEKEKLPKRQSLQSYKSDQINPIVKLTYGAFTLGVKSVLNENLGGILGGSQC
jgi:hypothetical protein